MTFRITHVVAIAALVGAGFAPVAQAQPVLTQAELHARAVASFQQGRFPEAYGRFIALANGGHAPAAELALFMSQNDSALFGNDWDVTQAQLTAWSALAGRPAPVLQVRNYPRTAAPAAVASR
jgi:hypothetical protein